MHMILKKLFDTKWKQYRWFEIEYCLNRIFSISNYEHGADEKQKISSLEKQMMDNFYLLGILDDFYRDLDKFKNDIIMSYIDKQQ